MTKTIHIVGAGGPAGAGMTRCLKDHYQVTGTDSSPWSALMIECPEDRSPANSNLVIPMADISVLNLANPTMTGTFLPPREQVVLCQDKARTAEVLGNLAPKTYWVRDTKGAGGAGAQMASELLPGNNYSQEFVFYNGEKVADFQKQRISYSVKERTEGLDNRGSSAVSVCTRYGNVRRRSEEALNKVATATGTLLHGFYGVDLKCDSEGVPKVTEINAGRLLTASYSYYWLTGYNLPLVGVRAFFGEDMPKMPDYPEGWGIVRQSDQLPGLFPPEITKGWL